MTHIINVPIDLTWNHVLLGIGAFLVLAWTEWERGR